MLQVWSNLHLGQCSTYRSHSVTIPHLTKYHQDHQHHYIPSVLHNNKLHNFDDNFMDTQYWTLLWDEGKAGYINVLHFHIFTHYQIVLNVFRSCFLNRWFCEFWTNFSITQSTIDDQHNRSSSCWILNNRLRSIIMLNKEWNGVPECRAIDQRRGRADTVWWLLQLISNIDNEHRLIISPIIHHYNEHRLYHS